MNCRNAQRLLSAERDGALADSKRIDLEAHVGACAECRQARFALAEAVEHWRGTTGRVLSPDPERAWQDIRREIRRNESPSAAQKEKTRLLRWGVPTGAVAALIFAAALGAHWLGTSIPEASTHLNVARADFVETASGTSSMVYVDDKSGWLVVWAVNDSDPL